MTIMTDVKIELMTIAMTAITVMTTVMIGSVGNMNSNDVYSRNVAELNWNVSD